VAKDKVTFDEFMKYEMKKKNTTMVLINKQKKEEKLKPKLSKCFNYGKAVHRRTDYWASRGKAIGKNLQ
jgi:hypothetical protein